MKILPPILSYLSFAVILAMPPIILQYSGNTDMLAPHFWLIFFFLSGLTFLVLASILFVQQKNEDYYAQAFLGATTVKILACIIFIVIYLMKNIIAI